VALWAFLSEEAEAKLASGKGRMRPDEWKSGDRCWVIEVVAPFATPENQMVARMLTDLSQTALKEQVFSLYRTDTETGLRGAVKISATSEVRN
jgi:cytolysin-activating lysine-acyltransferase